MARDEYGHAYRLMIRDKFDGAYGDWHSVGSYRTKKAALEELRIWRAGGHKAKEAKIVPIGRKNPGTKAERAVKAQKERAKRRVAVALAKYLKQVNPSATHAKVQKLKGGVIKITPMKAPKKGKR